jgi:hypothetical protein
MAIPPSAQVVQDSRSPSSSSSADKFTPTSARFANGQLPTPPRSSHNRKRASPSIDSGFSIDQIPNVPAAQLPALRRAEEFKAANALLNETEQVAEATSHLPAPSRKSSTQQRANSLMERIRAKEKAQAAASSNLCLRQPKLGLVSPGQKSLKANSPAAERERLRMAEFKRKSMLSRLPDVADAISM